MKNFWILITLICSHIIGINPVPAQSDTLYLYQAYHTFSNAEKAEWTAFENNWNYFEYSTIKKNYKLIKLNCKNCESFYGDMFLNIDSEGRFSVIHFIKGKKCGVPCNDSAFTYQFENSLKKQQFHSLKNKQFIARFGHILKC